MVTERDRSVETHVTSRQTKNHIKTYRIKIYRGTSGLEKFIKYGIDCLQNKVSA